MDTQNWLERARQLLALRRFQTAQYVEAIGLRNIGHIQAFNVADHWDPRETLNQREEWFIRNSLREIGGRLLMQQGILPGSAGWDPVWD